MEILRVTTKNWGLCKKFGEPKEKELVVNNPS